MTLKGFELVRITYRFFLCAVMRQITTFRGRNLVKINVKGVIDYEQRIFKEFRFRR